MPALIFPHVFLRLAVVFALAVGAAQTAHAASRERIEAFLTVTGFDVALSSIALSAGNAPMMLGLEAKDFGADWTRTAAEVFDTDAMHKTALDILEQTLDDDDLIHAVEFYASDLGQRLVEIENASHMEKDRDDKREAGRVLFAELVAKGSPRVAMFQRMNDAISSADSAVRAVEEIQLRFLLSADAAGVIDLAMDEGALRAAQAKERGVLRTALSAGALTGAAYTYRNFSDADIEAYAEALEHPRMQRVYELLNAVQHEITANRFEVLASRMADLHPGEEL